VDGVSHYGGVLRVALRGVADAEADVRATLQGAGFALQRIALGWVSVEDAFVSMVREDERRRARQAA
jgi:hypothetical protein